MKKLRPTRALFVISGVALILACTGGQNKAGNSFLESAGKDFSSAPANDAANQTDVNTLGEKAITAPMSARDAKLQAEYDKREAEISGKAREDEQRGWAKIERDAEEFERWSARVSPLPRNAFPKIGSCYSTRIKETYGRFGGAPLAKNGGSTVEYENSLRQVSYQEIPQIVRSRPGDRVTMCVVDYPRDCPQGDFAGIIYRTYNRRTHEYWVEQDSAHICGG